MPRRRLAPPGPSRRSSSWWATVVAGAIVALLAATGCEADPDSSTAAAVDPGASTTVAGWPAEADDPDATTATAVVPTLDPATIDRAPGGVEIVTGGTAVSQPSRAGTMPNNIRTVDFAELTYPTSVCAAIIDRPPSGGYRLVDGETSAPEGDAAGPYSVTLRPSRSFGDINGDGHEDAALMLECSRGGQPAPTGWIYTLDASGPRPLTGVVLDPDSLPITGVLDASLTDLRIAEATVVTDWDVYIDGDARCCPTKTAVVEWTWTDGRLTAGPPTLIDADARG